jgi:outer membrane protein assembly factor BamB
MATSTNLLTALINTLLFLSPSPETPVGWRMDGSGRYASAIPPTEWSEDKNVVWKTKLPGRSQGSAILVGERIFVACDPAELICLNAADGELVWQRSNTPQGLYGAAKGKEIAAEYARLRREQQDLERRHGKAKNDKEKQKEIGQQLEGVRRERRALGQRFPQPASYADGETSNSAATPVCDGANVYALFGNGIACAYSLSGERRWIKFYETPAIVFGHASSPVVAAGKLIFHLNDVFAVTAATGEVAWRIPLPARHASPLATQVGETSVVVSPAGAVVRVSDGKVLLKSGALSASECSPVLKDDVIYAIPGGARAVRLVPADDAVKLEKLWEAKTVGGRRTPSPVLHDGLLYGVNTDGILEVLDAANGDLVYKQRLEIGSMYSSVTAAGGYLYLGSTRGTTIVMSPGREYQEVARNKLEGGGGSPVFRGRRMFLHTRQHVYCVGQ